MKACICHRCGEQLTSPYFYEGKAYGWTCIKIVNPSAKHKKIKEHWVIADSHNLDLNGGKQQGKAMIDNKKYGFLVLRDAVADRLRSLDNYAFIDETNQVYINVAAFSKKI